MHFLPYLTNLNSVSVETYLDIAFLLQYVMRRNLRNCIRKFSICVTQSNTNIVLWRSGNNDQFVCKMFVLSDLVACRLS